MLSAILGLIPTQLIRLCPLEIASLESQCPVAMSLRFRIRCQNKHTLWSLPMYINIRLAAIPRNCKFGVPVSYIRGVSTEF